MASNGRLVDIKYLQQTGTLAELPADQSWRCHENEIICQHEVHASALSACASAPLSLGFAVFPLIVPFVVGAVGWQLGFTIVICPLLLVSVIAAVFLPNRPSGIGLEQ